MDNYVFSELFQLFKTVRFQELLDVFKFKHLVWADDVVRYVVFNGIVYKKVHRFPLYSINGQPMKDRYDIIAEHI